MIKIGHINNAPENAIYIGRKMPGLPASPLGNPFKLSPEEPRGSTIKKYRRWLWKELQYESLAKKELARLVNLYLTEGELFLACWCRKTPQSKAACHGEVIRSAIFFLMRCG